MENYNVFGSFILLLIIYIKPFSSLSLKKYNISFRQSFGEIYRYIVYLPLKEN